PGSRLISDRVRSAGEGPCGWAFISCLALFNSPLSWPTVLITTCLRLRFQECLHLRSQLRNLSLEQMLQDRLGSAQPDAGVGVLEERDQLSDGAGAGADQPPHRFLHQSGPGPAVLLAETGFQEPAPERNPVNPCLGRRLADGGRRQESNDGLLLVLC